MGVRIGWYAIGYYVIIHIITIAFTSIAQIIRHHDVLPRLLGDTDGCFCPCFCCANHNYNSSPAGILGVAPSCFARNLDHGIGLGI